MKPWIKWTALILAVVLLFGGCGYLFWYDRYERGSQHGYMTGSYEPEVDDWTVIHQLQQLNIPITSVKIERTVEQDGVEAFINLTATPMQSTETAEDEIERIVNDLTKHSYPRVLTWSVSGASQQAVLTECQYVPWIDAIGYGWIHYNNNLYASVYGKEKAEAMPNYRNRFRFAMQKDEVVYTFDVFCDTHEVDEAFTAAVSAFNENVK